MPTETRHQFRERILETHRRGYNHGLLRTIDKSHEMVADWLNDPEVMQDAAEAVYAQALTDFGMRYGSDSLAMEGRVCELIEAFAAERSINLEAHDESD